MTSRPYPRPFTRAVSPVRSRAAAGVALVARYRRLRRSYRRTIGLAFVVSALVHVVAFRLGGPGEPPDLRPDPTIGYEGPIEVLAIRVIDAQTDQVLLAEERRRSGALVATEIDSETNQDDRRAQTPEPSLEVPSPQAELTYYVVEAPATRATKDAEPTIRVELREDLSVEEVTARASHSLEIKLLWVVRPDYPSFARRHGIEGLVRLEAEVGISGKVLDVHVLEAPDGALALAASRSLLLWEFQPLRVDGQLRKFRVVVPFRFTLI